MKHTLPGVTWVLSAAGAELGAAEDWGSVAVGSAEAAVAPLLVGSSPTMTREPASSPPKKSKTRRVNKKLYHRRGGKHCGCNVCDRRGNLKDTKCNICRLFCMWAYVCVPLTSHTFHPRKNNQCIYTQTRDHLSSIKAGDYKKTASFQLLMDSMVISVHLTQFLTGIYIIKWGLGP